MLTIENKQNLAKLIRATNYLSVAQIFLQDNFLLERPLVSSDIKNRLLGHFGTCPGINIIYAHLSLLIKQQNLKETLFVLGPGHGFPALQANLFLEKALLKVDQQATLDRTGIAYVAKQFSWPYGYPSHANPQAPGVISEGGELGYSLATAFGSVLDNPNLVTFCLIGDGEAETAALAASWQLNKIISSSNNGVVLPILHLNGYKISGPTIFGRMSDKELVDYFNGLRYEPMIIDYNSDADDEQLNQILSKAYQKISQAKQNSTVRLPMIIFRSPKGLTGIKELNGKKIENNNLSHQVILSKAKTDVDQLVRLEQWLKSYDFSELFDGQNFLFDLDNVFPDEQFRMGNSRLALGQKRVQLLLPDINFISTDSEQSFSMNAAGEYLREVFKLNQQNYNFRLFSPDETTSNRLQAVFSETNRAWNAPIFDWDDHLASDGRVMELLSEQILQGLYQGYVLTGRYGAMTSYEAFMMVASSMVDQYSKFIKQAQQIPFRQPLAPMVYLLTSIGWRQDHNGFSHQNPNFIAGILNQQTGSNVVFPSDQNMMLALLNRIYQTNNTINAVVAGKQAQTIWRNLKQAKSDIKKGASIWTQYSDSDPDLVLSVAGDYVLAETVQALEILRRELPKIKYRLVYLSALSTDAIGFDDNRLTRLDFDKIFTKDRPLIFNFHGYPSTLKSILFNYLDSNRATVHGYIEQGSTTTPFDMMIRNQTSRWHLVLDALDKLLTNSKIKRPQYELLSRKYQQKIKESIEYVKVHGIDLDFNQ